VRVWIDISNSPQVPFFRPLIALLEARGHDVQVTTRDYAQTLELLRLHGIHHEVVGPRHGGAAALGKGRAMARRLRALRRFARGRDFDIALSHASHELPLVARSPLATRLRLRARPRATRLWRPRRTARRRSRGDPARAARPAGRAGAKG